MISGTDRLPGAREWIEEGVYFGVHGPCQIGKTTALMGLAEELTAEGRYAALHVSCEDARAHEGSTWKQLQRVLVHALRVAAAVRLPLPLRPPGAVGARPAATDETFG